MRARGVVLVEWGEGARDRAEARDARAPGECPGTQQGSSCAVARQEGAANASGASGCRLRDSVAEQVAQSSDPACDGRQRQEMEQPARHRACLSIVYERAGETACEMGLRTLCRDCVGRAGAIRGDRSGAQLADLASLLQGTEAFELLKAGAVAHLGLGIAQPKPGARLREGDAVEQELPEVTDVALKLREPIASHQLVVGVRVEDRRQHLMCLGVEIGVEHDRIAIAAALNCVDAAPVMLGLMAVRCDQRALEIRMRSPVASVLRRGDSRDDRDCLDVELVQRLSVDPTPGRAVSQAAHDRCATVQEVRGDVVAVPAAAAEGREQRRSLTWLPCAGRARPSSGWL